MIGKFFTRELRRISQVCSYKFAKNQKSTQTPETSIPESGRYTVTIFPGDGIGPEISQSVVDLFSAVKAPIDWEFHQIHKKAVTASGDLISEESLESVKKNKWALKGPFETPIGKGHRSLNVTLRKRL